MKRRRPKDVIADAQQLDLPALRAAARGAVIEEPAIVQAKIEPRRKIWLPELNSLATGTVVTVDRWPLSEGISTYAGAVVKVRVDRLVVEFSYPKIKRAVLDADTATGHFMFGRDRADVYFANAKEQKTLESLRGKAEQEEAERQTVRQVRREKVKDEKPELTAVEIVEKIVPVILQDKARSVARLCDLAGIEVSEKVTEVLTFLRTRGIVVSVMGGAKWRLA